MNRPLALRLLLVAGVLGSCVAGFFACFEKRSVEIESRLSAEARRNRHLALGRLLERMGHEVVAHEDLDALDELPAPPATVFLTSNRTTLPARRSEALLDWVAGGGHLVVVTYTVWEHDAREGERITSGKPDLLLDRFGLKQRQARPEVGDADIGDGDVGGEDIDDEEAGDEDIVDIEIRAEDGGEETRTGAPEPAAPEEAEPTTDEGERSAPPTGEPAWAYLEDGEEPFELRFTPSFWWDDPDGAAVWSVAGDAGLHLIEVVHGAGRISALTSDEPLVNATIGEADHAEFIVRWLRDGRESRAPVWIFVQEGWPSLFVLLREHAWPALAAGAVLLALWLWRALFRFGPALPAPSPARRSWVEHLEAAGRFHWRQDRGAVLLDALRRDFAREFARKRPSWKRLPERERMERLAHASGLSLPEVTHALLDSGRAPKSFAAAVRLIERLRAAL